MNQSQRMRTFQRMNELRITVIDHRAIAGWLHAAYAQCARKDGAKLTAA